MIPGLVNSLKMGKWGRNALIPAVTLVAGGFAGAAIANLIIDPSNISVAETHQIKDHIADPVLSAKTDNSDDQNASLVLATYTKKSGKTGKLSSFAEPIRLQKPLLPVNKTVSVAKGDTLMKVLTRAGADRQESHEAVTALTKVFDPRSLKIGQDIFLTFEYDDAGDSDAADETTPRLVEVALKEDVDRHVAALRSNGGNFTPKETVLELKKDMVRAGGVINNSLFLAAAKAGVPTKTIIEMIRIFSYDVDFQREIQPGDSFEIFFERYLNEQKQAVKDGNIVWASMTLSGEKISLYRFKTSDDGFTDYYTAKGHSTKKTLMRTPIDGARLTSRFGKRRHPVLG